MKRLELQEAVLHLQALGDSPPRIPQPSSDQPCGLCLPLSSHLNDTFCAEPWHVATEPLSRLGMVSRSRSGLDL